MPAAWRTGWSWGPALLQTKPGPPWLCRRCGSRRGHAACRWEGGPSVPRPEPAPWTGATAAPCEVPTVCPAPGLAPFPEQELCSRQAECPQGKGLAGLVPGDPQDLTTEDTLLPAVIGATLPRLVTPLRGGGWAPGARPLWCQRVSGLGTLGMSETLDYLLPWGLQS